MAHELATTVDGRIAMAYAGNTPWHGLGQNLTPGADLLTWQQEAGLDWSAEVAPVRFDRAILDTDGSTKTLLTTKRDSCVIYRSDDGTPLSVVSDRYKPVQPRDVIEFYRDLTERHGYVMETAGVLKGGRKIWALARTGAEGSLRGNDTMRAYLLLATSYDGTMATQARFTSIRVVCNNTITLATTEGRADVTVPHSTTFDADKVKIDLNIGDAWAAFIARSAEMSARIVSKQEQVKLLLDVYYGADTDEKRAELRQDEKASKSVEKFIERMGAILTSAPGAAMSSANGTLWGLVNAITFDVDHTKPARSTENRLNSAWFGPGEAIKRRAWDAANKLLQAA